MTGIEPFLVAAGGLLVLGVVGSKAAGRLGVPAVLLFLVLGMLAGSDGPGGIEFNDPEIAQRVGVVALAFILFSGGLATRWSDVEEAAGPGAVLASVGVTVTAAVTGLFTYAVLDLSLAASLLLGAIIASTDAAAVFSILRSRSIALRNRIKPTLELESGSNDPMAVFLTVAVLGWIDDPGRGVAGILVVLALQVVLGVAGGVAGSALTLWALNSLRLEYEGLYPVVTVAAVLSVFGLTTLAGGSGFLAVYLLGLLMGRREFVHRVSLMRFHDAIAWLGQIAMFGVLGLLVFPSQLVDIALPAMAISVALILVARPLATVLVLVPARFPLRDQLTIAWVGLRGAVPIILATFALVEGIDGAETIFNVVFFVVLTSVIIQGTTIPTVARLLQTAEDRPEVLPYPLEFLPHAAGSERTVELTLHPEAAAVGLRLFELGLPPGALVLLIRRDNTFVVPQGGTYLEANDDLLVLCDPADIATITTLVAEPGDVGQT
ncbi:MAG: potassium/proton antiporter [Acidimicrobiales bacterium]